MGEWILKMKQNKSNGKMGKEIPKGTEGKMHQRGPLPGPLWTTLLTATGNKQGWVQEEEGVDEAVPLSLPQRAGCKELWQEEGTM